MKKWFTLLLIATFGSMLAQAVMAQDSLVKTTVAYRIVDGHSILADVYRPKGDALCPVIVFIHGGALIIGNRELLLPQFTSLAQQKGYAILSIDYRLAPETKLDAIVSDIQAAFTWLGTEGGKRFHLDTSRMVVAGNSAGGYLTLVTGYRVSPKPKALVALYGYGQLNADWLSKPNPYPWYNEKTITREEAADQTDGSKISDDRKRKGQGLVIYKYYRQNGTWPQEVTGFDAGSISEKVAPYEPLKNITRDYPATFLMHGTQDTDVPYEESVGMAAELERHGVPYIFKSIDKGEHGFVGGNQKQIQDGYNAMSEFITRYLEQK